MIQKSSQTPSLAQYISLNRPTYQPSAHDNMMIAWSTKSNPPLPSPRHRRTRPPHHLSPLHPRILQLSTRLADRVVIIVEGPRAILEQLVLSLDINPIPVLLLAARQGRVKAFDDLVGCRVGGVVVAAGEEVVDFEAHAPSCCGGVVWGWVIGMDVGDGISCGEFFAFRQRWRLLARSCVCSYVCLSLSERVVGVGRFVSGNFHVGRCSASRWSIREGCLAGGQFGGI